MTPRPSLPEPTTTAPIDAYRPIVPAQQAPGLTIDTEAVRIDIGGPLASLFLALAFLSVIVLYTLRTTTRKDHPCTTRHHTTRPPSRPGYRPSSQ